MPSRSSLGSGDWDWKKIGVICGCCICVLLTILISLNAVIVYKLYLGPRPNPEVNRPFISSISYDYEYRRPMPIIRSNLIFFSININNLSDSMNQLIEDKNLNIPPAKFYDSSLSYVNSTGWIVITNDYTVFFLYDDVSNKLTLEEVRAVSLHELGHIVLRNAHGKKTEFFRDIEVEKGADRLAIAWGADPEYLISAITKLSMNKEEASHRKQEIYIN